MSPRPAAPQRRSAILEAARLAQEAGDHRRAEQCYRHLLGRNAGDADAWHYLGICLYEQNRTGAALEALGRAERLRPDEPMHAANHARVLRETGDPASALQRIDKALVPGHDNPRLVAERARILQRLQRADEAATQLASVLEANPADGELWRQLGECREQATDAQGALEAYDRALALDPSDPLTHLGIAQARHRQGDLAGTRRALEQALAAKSRSTMERGRILLATAELDAEEGRFEAAANRAREALAQEPDLYAAWLLLVPDRSFVASEALRGALRSALASAGPDPYAWPLYFAWGRALEAGGDYEQAFGSYAEGNRRREKLLPYSPAAQEAYADGFVKAFDARFLERRPPEQETSVTPIFIVGLPRSGSTLLESALAAHPEVAAAGEMTVAYDWVHRKLGGHALARLGPAIAALSTTQLTQLAMDWRRSLVHAAHGKPWVTDKLPENFYLLPLLHLCFPDAPIITMARDPRDVCFSCFTTPFMSGQPQCARPEWLAHHYFVYRKLMASWTKLLPAQRLIPICYEDLVREPEPVLRRLLASLGLPWAPQCTAFGRGRRAVATGSLYQVRQPLYHHAIGRWRRFAAYLGPLVNALEHAERHDSQERR